VLGPDFSICDGLDRAGSLSSVGFGWVMENGPKDNYHGGPYICRPLMHTDLRANLQSI